MAAAVAVLPGLELGGPRGGSGGGSGSMLQGPLSARRSYPRARAGERASSRPRSRQDEDFAHFLNRTAPSPGELKENAFDKSATEPLQHEAYYTAGHISIAPPEEKLELALKDRRRRPLPNSLRSEALSVLDRPLRCLDYGGKAPAGHPSDEFCNQAAALVPPQPIPEATQKLESEFLDTLEKSLREGQAQMALWDQYAKRAEELLITMPLEKVLRVLKAFVLGRYRGGDLYRRIGAELAKDVKSASSTRLCQVLHWLARAGLRDQTLMTLMGNETLLRLSDDFVLDMYIEVLNVHAKLDIRNPRLIAAVLRDLVPLFPELSRDQCCALMPLTVMNVLPDQARAAYLSRCAALNVGLPVQMTKPAVLRQFRLLEDCLRLDYHPTAVPSAVQFWLTNLREEADAHDIVEPGPLSPVEEDVLRILREEMDVPATPTLQDGVLTLHLIVGRTVLEVLDSHQDYYITPALGGGQRLLRADTKLRHRRLWRRGWRLLSIEESEWAKLGDDIYKKDMLEEMLGTGPRPIRNIGPE